MKFQDMRRLIDRSVQYASAVYFSLICSDEEAKELAVKDNAEKPKK